MTPKKTNNITDHERMGDVAFELAIAEYFAKDSAKPRSNVYYMPTAQRPAESLIGPLQID